MVAMEPNFKKIHRKKHEITSIYLFTLTSQKSEKHTCGGTRGVIHLSTHSYDAMYRMREGKSKLEPFYRLFRELFAIFFGPRLSHMFEQSLKLVLHIPN